MWWSDFKEATNDPTSRAAPPTRTRTGLCNPENTAEVMVCPFPDEATQDIAAVLSLTPHSQTTVS